MAHRSGLAAIVGRPNVGKSTLLNHLVGQKISITSRKPQTTRQRVTGILTRPEGQVVFVDTPGFQTEHRTALNRVMNRTVRRALDEVDLVLWVIEAGKFDSRDEALLKLMPEKVPVVLVMNKIDRLKDKRSLLPFTRQMSDKRPFAAIVPVSAERDQQLPELVQTMVELLPEGERMYDEDEVTTLSERFLAAELVREKLFRLLGDELPYATAVEIETFETTGNLRRIGVGILVDRANQKAIVIGKDGEKLKKIGTQARKDMEGLFGGKVFLETWVRVRSGWADDEATLKRMGIE
ncbi:MAG TPA: GTPase Era [Burkholderiales bacterium]|jgi:GTP-binding protein Era|nr:GTPase Era [Burkholderiales bacterium]